MKQVLTHRLNVKLEMKGVEPMKDLVKDFSDGVKLIQVRSAYRYLPVYRLTPSFS